MNYCENCYHLTNQERCPYCHSAALREVHDDDYCFLITQLSGVKQLKKHWNNIILFMNVFKRWEVAYH